MRLHTKFLRLARSSWRPVSVGVSVGCGALVSLATTTFLARAFGPERFGAIALALSVINMCAAISASGNEHATARYGVPASGLNHLIVRQSISASALALAAGGVLYTLIDRKGGTLALWLAPTVPAFALFRVTAALRRCAGDIRATYAVNTFGLSGPRLLALAAVLTLSLQSPDIAFSAGSAAIAITVAVAVYMAVRSNAPCPLPIVADHEWHRFAQRWRQHAIAQAALSWLDIPLISVILDPVSAGRYALVTRLGMAPRLFATGLGTWYATQIGTGGKGGDPSGTHAYRLVRLVGAGLVALGCIAIYSFSSDYFQFTGQHYSSQARILLLLVLSASVVDAAYGPNAWALGYTADVSFVRYVEWASVLLYFAMLLVLTPIIGMVGAGVAWLTMVILANVARSKRLGSL